MARMYSRKRGKSGSSRPSKKKAAWVSYKPEEIEQIIVKLAKSGMSQAGIGTVIRDQYGIPSAKAVAGKRVQEVIHENKLAAELPDDLLNLIRSAVKLKAHLTRNKHDRYSKRGLELTESKIRRLAKYYKRKEILQEDWGYDPEKAKLLVR
ncbi:MAG: 30S ribosomal protein S15 [Candidatus Aenigmarchaeota archaeon]|nr:30S ribosomal protein S15 [Candidatus Aenigmarchaeota archaeon]